MPKRAEKVHKGGDGPKRSLVGALRGVGLAVLGFAGLELLETIPDLDVPDKAKPWVAIALLLLRSLEGTFDQLKKGNETVEKNALGFEGGELRKW